MTLISRVRRKLSIETFTLRSASVKRENGSYRTFSQTMAAAMALRSPRLSLG